MKTQQIFKLQPELSRNPSGRAGLLLSPILSPLLWALWWRECCWDHPAPTYYGLIMVVYLQHCILACQQWVNSTFNVFRTLLTNELIYPHNPAGREEGRGRVSLTVFWIKEPIWGFWYFSWQESIVCFIVHMTSPVTYCSKYRVYTAAGDPCSF